MEWTPPHLYGIVVPEWSAFPTHKMRASTMNITTIGIDLAKKRIPVARRG
jgi:hypothetical protein